MMTKNTFKFDETIEEGAIIHIVGVGKTGLRAVSKMGGRIHKVKCVGVQSAPIDTSVTNALPMVNISSPGQNKTLNLDSLVTLIKNSDLIFLVAHLHDVLDSLLLDICTAVSRQSATLILVVPEPLDDKGRPVALPAYATIRAAVDGMILVSMDSLVPLELNAPQVFDEITMHDYLLRLSIEKVTDLITTRSLMCMDFADIRTIINGDGVIRCGTGIASGTDRGISATEKAFYALRQQGMASLITSPRILCSISASGEMTMEDFNNVNRLLHVAANEDANIKIGTIRHDEMGNILMVTIYAVELHHHSTINQHLRNLCEKEK